MNKWIPHQSTPCTREAVKKRENLGLLTFETPPPTPKCSQIWDFYRELAGNFRQICHPATRPHPPTVGSIVQNFPAFFTASLITTITDIGPFSCRSFLSSSAVSWREKKLFTGSGSTLSTRPTHCLSIGTALVKYSWFIKPNLYSRGNVLLPLHAKIDKFYPKTVWAHI